MPVIDDFYSGMKSLTYNPNNKKGFVGTIMITDPNDGTLKGLLDAKEITGVRTAMMSCIAILNHLSEYINTGDRSLNVTLFGTGLQAFWHVFILLRLYSPSCLDVKVVNINVLYRSNELDVTELKHYLEDFPCPINISQRNWDDTGVPIIVSTSNIIFGCTPTDRPHLFYKDLLFSSDDMEGEIELDRKTYISLIGSYKPEMHECDGLLIQKFLYSDVKIIVDSKTHTLLEAGELISSGVKAEHLIELGQLDTSRYDSLPLLTTMENVHKKITLCKVVGLAILDIALAKKYLSKHKK